MPNITEMARFGPFHRKFSYKPKPNQPKNTFINYKTHLYQLTTLLNINSIHNPNICRFHTYLSTSFHTKFYTFAFPYLFLPSSFFFFSFSLFFSSLLNRFALSQKPKNEIFCFSLIRPCLALYNFVLLFGFLLLGPSTSF